MKTILWAMMASLSLSGSAVAQDVDAVIAAAERSFDRMPTVARVDVIAGRCGADGEVNRFVAYCTSQNTIFLTATGPTAAYQLAHVYGHAVQVRHGVADVALRTIRANRDKEAALRMDVTRMVECIAGVILHRAGAGAMDLTQMFAQEPFTGSHWGRDPLARGPIVNLGLRERNRWLNKGLAAGDPAVCDTGEFPATLVQDAFRR